MLNTDPSWGTEFMIVDVDNDAETSFKVIEHFGLKTTLGEVKSTLGELIENQNESLKLPKGTLKVRIRRELDDAATVAKGLNQLQTDANVRSETGRTGAECLGLVVQSLSQLMNIADSFSQIHPYVRFAWQIVSSVYAVRKLPRTSWIVIVDLLATMESMYSFVSTLESLGNGWKHLHDNLEDVIQSILKQTLECILFVQGYSGHGFAEKALRGIVDKVDNKIESFKTAFMSLAASFDTAMAVHSTIVSFRIESKIDKMILKDELNPVEMIWSDRPQCHPKTRLDTISQITDWSTNFSDSGHQNVLWVVGPAGSGKSALSTTIANMFADMRRLGAFFFFDRDVDERKEPGAVIRSIAYQLARFDSRLSKQIDSAVTRNSYLVNMKLYGQFQELVKQPLESLAEEIAKEGPFAIVIDALDECGSPQKRNELVEVLANKTANLPPFCRIIITSRRTPDIELKFQNQAHIRVLDLDPSKNDEIEVFVKQELRQISQQLKLGNDWPGASEITQLVELAAGLWIWASTACRFISNYYPPNDALKQLLTGTGRFGLEDIYLTALQSSTYNKSPRFQQDCCMVLGFILVAKYPLSPTTIDIFLGPRILMASQNILSQLRSIVHQQGDGSPVRFLHASFGEFISEPSRKGTTWSIDRVECNQLLAESCIRVLHETFSDQAKFHVNLSLNGDIVNDLGEGKYSITRQRDGIPDIDEALAYACIWWTSHIIDMTVCPVGFEKRLLDFLQKNLLHWLEAMSILKQSRTTGSSLFQLLGWASIHIAQSELLIDLLYDAYRFAAFFATTIEKDPRYVYLSALPFAPIQSSVFRLFSGHHTDIPSVARGFNIRWSRSLRLLDRTDSRVNSLAISPDGMKMVSSGYKRGYYSKASIRIWNVITGAQAIPAIEVDGPSAVEFSPDSKFIWLASGQGSIYILDASTGVIDSKLTKENWSLKHEETSKENQEKHIIGHLSGDDLSINSASDRYVIPGARSGTPPPHWDTDRGERVHRLEGHRDEVTAIVFSSDGQKLLTSAEDKTLRVWNIAQGNINRVIPLETSQGIQPLRFTADGRRLVSTFKDSGTMLIWDLTVEKDTNPMQLWGQFNPVSAVAMSQHGSLLFSGAFVHRICMWDITMADGADAVFQQTGIQQHDRPVHNIQFSPNGLVVMSWREGSKKFWDSNSGKELKTIPHEKNATFIIDGEKADNPAKNAENPNTTERTASRTQVHCDGKPLNLVDAETNEEWVLESASPTVLASKTSGGSLFWGGDGMILQRIGDVPDGQIRRVWNLPLELECRSSDFHGNLAAFGFYNGRVVIVRFTDHSLHVK